MGVSSQPSFVPISSFKDLVKGVEVETKNSSCGYDDLQRKEVESQKVTMTGKKSVKKRRWGRIVMKRRARLMESSRRKANKIERRVTKLKRLIPNCGTMGLDRLFKKTADFWLHK